MITNYYPASPILPSKKLTSLTSSYLLRATLAVLGIVLFFILYSVLVVGLAYLLYYAIIYDMGRIHKWTILMKVGAIAGAGMLFLFTLKFIFKLKNHKPENRIKLKKEEHPNLWGFIDRICAETGAPKPKNIYVDPDVNAYVRYTNTWLSLFLPIPKELTIGLGLVDCLNLNEFKAVTAHEFGHFAQKSMKIGSYINSANTIIHDMIFDRDRWDNLLDQWRGADIRLSAAAWLITPIIWIIRQLLNLFYQFLNIMYSSLSREMEFNADKVAVSTSGSDAIVSALWKLDDGSATWNNTVNNAYLASQKSMVVGNLYEHCSNAMKTKVIPKLKKEFEGLPEDPRGGKHYFANIEETVVGMYASHPPNSLREENAKSPYIHCPTDDRSPWILFGDAPAIQLEMTTLVYDQYLKVSVAPNTNFNAFEDFIKAETSGTELLEEYHNTFQNRYLSIPDITNIPKIKELGIKDPLHFDNLKDELEGLMKPVKVLDDLIQRIEKMAQGSSKEKSITYKGIDYSKKNVQEVYTAVFNDREEMFIKDFKDWDMDFCYSYLNIGLQEDAYDQLYKHYRQHDTINRVYREFLNKKSVIYDAVNKLQAKTDTTERDVMSLSSSIKKIASDTELMLQEFDTIDFVELPNIENISELKKAIIASGSLKNTPGNIFENGRFDEIIHIYERTISHLHRVDQKSIAALLQKQKTIEERWNNNLRS